MATEVEGSLYDNISAGKGFVDAACVQAAGEAKVVAQLGVNNRRVRAKSGVHVERRRQGFPFDLHILHGVFGFGTGVGDHGHDRLALPAGAINRHGVLRRRFQADQMRQRCDPRFANSGQVFSVEHAQHAGHHAGKAPFNTDDARVRNR